MATEVLIDRAIRKFRDEMARQHLSQKDIADLLGRSQSWVAKLLNKRVVMAVSELEALCFALNLRPTEIVREDGYEFCAEMTPTELKVLEAYRQRPERTRAAINELLDVRAPSLARTRPLFGKPRPRG